MSTMVLNDLLTYLEPVICLIAILSIWRSGQVRRHVYVCGFLAMRIISLAIALPLLRFGGKSMEIHLAYKIYFYVYWISFGIETILCLAIIYSIFKLAMVPLKGLQSLGMLIFRWVGCISFALAIGAAFSPHISEIKFLTAAVSQLQRSESILTLCLLIFVCFAIRPMGLSFRSRIFGISLGLGIMATTNLVQAAWISYHPRLYSNYSIISGVSVCLAILVWTAYFALPEAKRRIIVLPTTSPFLRWNQISQVLGDAPGFVAIGGIPPELFAPAELEIMRRASLKMADQPVTDLSQSQTA
ncbi:hypothetical protein [Granulicella arctica]|uniref:Signal transduction histidine kinase n=1 Tax=Granulicella arctica TaxID=940613 RepID=A0A7Y9PEU7_9BACT|nr:hypothetical protein [Granulicella arctica]NYF78389.1 signal transduction histidine kinase [Granulicella arctica]